MTSRSPTTSRRPVKWKSYVRAWVAAALIATWVIVAVSGVLLWLAPEGKHSGQAELFLGLNKQEWGDIHWWVAVATMAVTAMHLVIDWRALNGALRYLVNVHRDRMPGS